MSLEDLSFVSVVTEAPRVCALSDMNMLLLLCEYTQCHTGMLQVPSSLEALSRYPGFGSGGNGLVYCLAPVIRSVDVVLTKL